MWHSRNETFLEGFHQTSITLQSYDTQSWMLPLTKKPIFWVSYIMFGESPKLKDFSLWDVRGDCFNGHRTKWNCSDARVPKTKGIYLSKLRNLKSFRYRFESNKISQPIFEQVYIFPCVCWWASFLCFCVCVHVASFLHFSWSHNTIFTFEIF